MTGGRTDRGVAMSEVQLLDIGQTEQEIFSRWDITGHQVNRHLLSKALTGTEDVVLDHLTFPPGFVHQMHRHPHADMVVIPVSGAVQFLGAPVFPVEVSPGQVLVIPRGNWHQTSDVGTQYKATGSLGRRLGSSSCVSQ